MSELINKIRNVINKKQNNFTAKEDKYLESLRRQRQKQLEEIEKVKLKNAIKKYQEEQSKKHLWGIKQTKKTPYFK